MPGQFTQGPVYQSTSQACLNDLEAPDFDGIESAAPKNNGAIQITWSEADDDTPPIRYRLYIALGDVPDTELYQQENFYGYAPPESLSAFLFSLAPGQWPDPDSPIYIIKDAEYTVGVLAEDAVGNVSNNTNLEVITAIGSIDLATIFQTLATQYAAYGLSFNASAISLAASVKGLTGGLQMSIQRPELVAVIEPTQTSMSIEVEENIP